MKISNLFTQFLVFTILFHIAPIANSQISLNKYFNPNDIPFINRELPLKIDIKWNMDGNNQILFNEGLNNLNEGNLNVSLGNFEEFLRSNYKSWIGHYYRGQVLKRMGRLVEAEAEFSSTLILKPKFFEGYIRLGEVYELQGNYNKAFLQFDNAFQLEPQNVIARYKLGNVALSRNNFAEAMKQYNKCIKLNKKFPDAFMTLGVIALKRGFFPDAVSNFNDALKADSLFFQAYFWRGYASLLQNESATCLRDWNLFMRYSPQNSFVMGMRGFLQTELGNYDEGFSDFRKSLQRLSINEDKFQGGQTVLDKRIDLQVAANYLVLKGYGLEEEAFKNLKAGFCLMAIGQDVKASNFLRKSARIKVSSTAFYLLGIVYEHLGDHESAYEFYDKALNLDNDIFDAHKKRGLYSASREQWDSAYYDFKEMLRLQPGAPVAYKLRGQMEYKRKNYQNAIDDFTQFVRSDSTDGEVLRTRSLCFSLLNKPEKAALDLKRVFVTRRDADFCTKVVDEHLAIGDTLNSLMVLKDYTSKNDAVQPMIQLSRILIQQKKYGDVLVLIAKAREIIKVEEEKLITKATSYGSLTYKVKQNRAKADLFYLEGLMAFKQSEYKDAISLLKKSLAEYQNNQEVLYLRAKCYIVLNDITKAIQDLTELKGRNYLDSDQLLNSLSKN